jgi:DNA-binding CsgD family transcriptional regulator
MARGALTRSATSRSTPLLAEWVRRAAEVAGGPVLMFSIRSSSEGSVLEHFEQTGLRAPSLIESKLEACVGQPGWAGLDGGRVPRDQRNRVITRAALSRKTSLADIPLHRDVLAAAKLADLDFSRVLVCDEASLVAVVYAFGAPTVTPAARRRLAGGVQFLKTALATTRRVEEVDLARAALSVTLEALPGEAWILDEAGEVALANFAGNSRLEEEGQVLAARLARAVRSCRGSDGAGTLDRLGFAVSRVKPRGRAQLFLVRAVAERGSDSTVMGASRRWGLTEKQTRVLALLCRGHANKAIASELGCAENTIEYHVTRLLAKANAESRAELIARLYASVPARTG